MLEDLINQDIRLALRDAKIREREERIALKEKLRLALMHYLRSHNIGPAGRATAEIMREIDTHIKSRAR